MKCFMHPDEEANSVCSICGKAMCANCSSYSGHSGVCPPCRKKEFEREHEENKAKIKSSIATTVLVLIVIIVFIVISIQEGGFMPLGIFGLGAIVILSLSVGINVNKLIKRNRFLMGEITKINTSLNTGNKMI